MNVLVSAGNTVTPIDRVRCITNIFTGRTGARIAAHARERGHAVRLLTSHPDVAEARTEASWAAPWAVQPYRTFEELRDAMAAAITPGGLDVVIHCAAVNDYHAAGVYSPAPGTLFQPATGRWVGEGPPTLLDRAAGKVKSDEAELWLRLVRAPKLVDFIRTEWGFRGVLVKFKLEVGLGDAALLEVAERSRRQSDADLMVANTLEGAGSWAYLGPLAGRYEFLSRAELAPRLLDAVEQLHEERHRG
jgi:phosphopantothenoylcysteine synthetase/decarboxylase